MHDWDELNELYGLAIEAERDVQSATDRCRRIKKLIDQREAQLIGKPPQHRHLRRVVLIPAGIGAAAASLKAWHLAHSTVSAAVAGGATAAKAVSELAKTNPHIAAIGAGTLATGAAGVVFAATLHGEPPPERYVAPAPPLAAPAPAADAPPPDTATPAGTTPTARSRRRARDRHAEVSVNLAPITSLTGAHPMRALAGTIHESGLPRLTHPIRTAIGPPTSDATPLRCPIDAMGTITIRICQQP